MLRSHTSYAFGCKVTKLFLYSILLVWISVYSLQKDHHNWRPVRYNNVEKHKAETEAEDAGETPRFYFINVNQWTCPHDSWLLKPSIILSVRYFVFDTPNKNSHPTQRFLTSLPIPSISDAQKGGLPQLQLLTISVYYLKNEWIMINILPKVSVYRNFSLSLHWYGQQRFHHTWRV